MNRRQLLAAALAPLAWRVAPDAALFKRISGNRAEEMKR